MYANSFGMAFYRPSALDVASRQTQQHQRSARSFVLNGDSAKFSVSPLSGQSSKAVAQTSFSRPDKVFNTPRFGWGGFSNQHAMIDDAAIALLADYQRQGRGESLLRFLTQSKPERDQRSRDLDKAPEPNGWAHFLNWELLGARPAGEEDKIIPFQTATLGDIVSQLSRQVYNRVLRDDWHKIKTYHSTATGKSGNILLNCQTAFERLTLNFEKIAQANRTNRVSVQERQALRMALMVSVADLMHYLGDLCQPLHVTTYCNWLLAHPFQEKKRNGSVKHFDGFHAYTEGERVTADIHLAPIRNRLSRPLQPGAEFQQRLLTEAKTAYQYFPTLLDADQQVRANQAGRRGKRGAETYHRELAQRISPILQTQMSAASRLIADVIWSAYTNAGQPDLSILSITGSRIAVTG